MRRRRNERSMRSELGSFVRSLLFLDLPHEEDYINGNLLIEYDQSSRIAEQSQMEVVAETQRRCTIEFLTIKDHIQDRGSKVPESIVRTFRCIQSTLLQVSLYVLY